MNSLILTKKKYSTVNFSVCLEVMEGTAPSKTLSAWRFWYTSYAGNKFSYGPLGASFQTIEDFWKIYFLIPTNNNFITQCPLTEMNDGGISLFKDGIEPIENDKHNEIRLISFSKDSNSFEFCLKMAISGQIDAKVGTECFNGVYSSKKKNDYRVELWFNNVQNMDELKNNLHSLLNISFKEKRCKKTDGSK